MNLNDLFSKLKVLQMTLPNVFIFVFEMLEFIKEEDCYPNIFIAYRMLLTLHVTVAEQK